MSQSLPDMWEDEGRSVLWRFFASGATRPAGSDLPPGVARCGSTDRRSSSGDSDSSGESLLHEIRSRWPGVNISELNNAAHGRTNAAHVASHSNSDFGPAMWRRSVDPTPMRKRGSFDHPDTGLVLNNGQGYVPMDPATSCSSHNQMPACYHTKALYRGVYKCANQGRASEDGVGSLKVRNAWDNSYLAEHAGDDGWRLFESQADCSAQNAATRQNCHQDAAARPQGERIYGTGEAGGRRYQDFNIHSPRHAPTSRRLTSVGSGQCASTLADDWHLYDLKSMDPLSFSLWFIASYSHFLYAIVPDYLLRTIPHCSSLVSMIALFFFTQALALLWGFLSIALSIMCTRSVQHLDKFDILAAVSMHRAQHLVPDAAGAVRAVDGGSNVLYDVFYVLTRFYMNFVVLELCWFVGASLFEIGWEMYGDFPRIRILLDSEQYTLPPRRGDPSPSSAAAASSACGGKDSAHSPAGRRARRVARTVQKIFLVSPIAVLLCLSLSLSLAPLVSVLVHGDYRVEMDMEPGDGGQGEGTYGGDQGAGSAGAGQMGATGMMRDAERGLLAMLMSNSSRFDRTLRVTILIGLVQWAQQFHFFFPRWYNCLHLTWGAFWVKGLLVALTPVSAYRLIEWMFFPSRSSALSPLFCTMPYQMIDNILVTLWSLLGLMASYVTLQLDGASLRAVGWRNRNFTEAHLWFRQSLRFKLTLVLPVLMHFLRGALSKYHGVSSAQKDAMLISVWYPLMLVLIWTSAYCSVILKPRDLLLAPPLVLVSYLVCTILGHVHAKGVMFAVALHMARALVQHKARGSAIQRAQEAPGERHSASSLYPQTPPAQTRLGSLPHAGFVGSGPSTPARGSPGSGSPADTACRSRESGMYGTGRRSVGMYASNGRLMELSELFEIAGPSVERLRAGRQAFGVPRAIAASISRLYLAAAAAFACTMLCLGVISVLQTEAALYPSASFIQLRAVPEHPSTGMYATQISHAIALLDLHHRFPPPPLPMPEQACAQTQGQRLGTAMRSLPQRTPGGMLASADEGCSSLVSATAPWVQRDAGDQKRARGDSRAGEDKGEFEKSEYAICNSVLWGLTPIDYALLSLAAYFKSSELPGIMPMLFPPERDVLPPIVVDAILYDGGTGGVRGDGDARDGDGEVFWTEFEFADKNLTVLALRGTQFWRVADWIEDVRLWTEPVVLSILSVVFPTLRAWSPHTTAMVLDTLHALLDTLGVPDPDYKYKRLVHHVEQNVKPRLPPNHEIVLTGHSLGGGIAHITAALVNTPVVAFSPPGAYQSLSKHLYWNAKDRRQMHHAAHNRTVTFVAEGDVIGGLDTHGGLVQTMTCQTDHLGAIGCHLLEHTLCNLVSQCGSDKRWHSCDLKYQVRPLLAEWMVLFQEASAGDKFARVAGVAVMTLALYIMALSFSIRWVWANLKHV